MLDHIVKYIFDFVRKARTFRSGCTILHSHEQYVRAVYHQDMMILVICILAILVGV